MRKLFNEFFYIPKHEKVREKVMLTRLVSTITVIVLCMAAMSFTAYAYFSYNITSGYNIIRSANFKTKVQVQIFDLDGNAVESNINPITSDYKSFKIEGLTVGETYTVNISPVKDEKSAKTGFIILTADNCPDTYYSQQLGKDEKVDAGETNKLSFKIIITDSTTVYLKAHWGTSSYYADFKNKAKELYITQDETVKLIVNGFDEPNVKKEDALDEADKTVDAQTNTTPPSLETVTPPVSTEPSEPTSTTEPEKTEITTSSELSEDQISTETSSTETNSTET